MLECLQTCVAGKGDGDPPAQVKALMEDSDFNGGKPEDMRALLDHCLCQVVDSTLDAEAGGSAALHAALDLTVQFAAQGLVDLPCPLNILNDVLSSQTIEECSNTFAYLESKKGLLLQGEFFAEHKKKNAKVALLRLCNAMVKRLSKSNDTVFCGRILMFLATVLSISDRSGVNLMGKFNTNNVTVYAEEAADPGDSSEPVTTSVDLNFYTKFWALQKIFINRELVHKEKYWGQLTEGVQLVFAAFASQSAIDESEGGDDGKRKEKGKKSKSKAGSSKSSASPPPPGRASSTEAAAASAGTAAAGAGEEFFAAKFLTSSHLMSLELRDPHFRRHILVQVRMALCSILPATFVTLSPVVETSAFTRLVFAQFLIFFQNLLRLPAVGAPQKLTVSQRKKVESFVKKTEQLLEKTGKKAKRFLGSTQHVLHREENWIDWKDRGAGQDRCPSLSVRLYLEVNSKVNPRIYVDVEGGDTVLSMKQKIADKLSIPVAEQRLAVGNVVLSDEKLVCDYPLPSKTVLSVKRVEPQPDLPPMRKRRQPQPQHAGKRVRLGTDELTRLWNCGSTDVDGKHIGTAWHYPAGPWEGSWQVVQLADFRCRCMHLCV